jgi:SAM-dependent methyltransferase
MALQKLALLGREACKRLTKLSVRGWDCGPHVTRYEMYRRIGEFFAREPRHGKILSISESEGLHDLFERSQSEIFVANYPEYNILRLPFPDETFDYCVSDQVLEHVEGDPQRAIDESFRVLKRGGWAIHTTCLMNPIHAAPNDFWRFTPGGLRYLFRAYSKIEQAEGWGNPFVHLMHVLDLRSVPIPNAPGHPLHKIATLNWANWPVMTWIIAQK